MIHKQFATVRFGSAAARLMLAAAALSEAGATARAQSPARTPFDACGVLISDGTCVLFEGGGGRYYLPEYGDDSFRVGDAVRIVGTLDPGCTAFCNDFDGCISGASAYDPAIYPCGTELPNLQVDIINGVCDSVTAALMGVIAGGLWLTWPRGARRV